MTLPTEARAEGGFTPLHFAASQGAAEAVNALLDAGANAKARDENGGLLFDLAESNEKLKGTDAWWRLHDARFE